MWEWRWTGGVFWISPKEISQTHRRCFWSNAKPFVKSLLYLVRPLYVWVYGWFRKMNFISYPQLGLLFGDSLTYGMIWDDEPWPPNASCIVRHRPWASFATLGTGPARKTTTAREATVSPIFCDPMPLTIPFFWFNFFPWDLKHRQMKNGL